MKLQILKAGEKPLRLTHLVVFQNKTNRLRSKNDPQSIGGELTVSWRADPQMQPSPADAFYVLHIIWGQNFLNSHHNIFHFVTSVGVYV